MKLYYIFDFNNEWIEFDVILGLCVVYVAGICDSFYYNKEKRQWFYNVP